MNSFGFVYLWYDRHSRLFYLGSHYGREDDGYIASSRWLLNAHRKRPLDFRRRIVARIYEDDKKALQALEQRFLDMIKPHEFATSANVTAGCHRYYNMKPHATGGNGGTHKGKSWPSWRKGLTAEMIELRKQGLFCVIACDRPKAKSDGTMPKRQPRVSSRVRKPKPPQFISARCEKCSAEFEAKLARKGRYQRFCSRSCSASYCSSFTDHAANGRNGAARMSEVAKTRKRIYNDDGSWVWGRNEDLLFQGRPLSPFELGG